MPYTPTNFSTTAVINADTLFQNYDDEVQVLMSDVGNYLTEEMVKVYTETETIVTDGIKVNSVETIEDLATQDGVVFKTIIVKDLNRGGTFIWSATGTANGGTVFAGATGYWNRQYSGAVNVKWFGAVGDGVTDDAEGIKNVIQNYKSIYLPSGTYYIENNLILDGLKGVTVFGDSKYSSVILLGASLYIKDIYKTSFKSLTFSGMEYDNILQNIFISYFRQISFDNCYFNKFGGSTYNKAGSTIMYLYASDTDSATLSKGSSSDFRVTSCDFSGASRKTNFGIRVYTEFEGGINTITSGTISNCSFGGFNWNAVEIAGRNTSSIIINNCIANLCGLQPFDIDKGANNCTISDCKINRLLGNIDTDINSETAVVVVGLQGRYEDEYISYGHNNVIENVSAFLLKSDIENFANEFYAVGITSSKDCIIRNISISCDGRPAAEVGEIKFGLMRVGTSPNCTVENIYCTNAQSGIRQASTFATIGSENYTNPITIKNITNIGTMSGEILDFSNSGQRVQVLCSNLNLKTDLSAPYSTQVSSNYFAIRAFASGGSSHYIIIRDSNFTFPNSSGYYFCLNQIAKLELSNIKINGCPTNDRFMHSGGSTEPQNLCLNNILTNLAREPIDMYNVLKDTDNVYLNYSIDEETTLPSINKVTLFATAIPLYPSSGNYTNGITIENKTKVAGGTIGWVSTASGWKSFGTISA